MTIDQTIEEIIERADEVQGVREEIKEIITRFALEFVEACVGVKQKSTHQVPQFCRDVKFPQIQWNDCREQTLEAARKLLGL